MHCTIGGYKKKELLFRLMTAHSPCLTYSEVSVASVKISPEYHIYALLDLDHIQMCVMNIQYSCAHNSLIVTMLYYTRYSIVTFFGTNRL